VNYDEKQLIGKNIFDLFLLYVQVRKYVSYGFPIIKFCNLGVHYETPCITKQIHEAESFLEAYSFSAT